MKKNLTLLVALLLFGYANAQTGLHTSGKYLLDICNDTVLLRGIDYPVYNWGDDNASIEFDQIKQTGANCVRMPWYKNTESAYYTNDLLDAAITACFANRMIPIIELHDETCNNDPQALINLATFYTDPDVLAIIQKHKDHLIINIANEALYHNFDENGSANYTAYVNTYSTIISNLRTANITVPLMIDAADCGQDIAIFSSAGSTLYNADPQHNIILSAHAYWEDYANNDSSEMDALIKTASQLNVPVILGEMSDFQDDPNPCDGPLEYKALLNICQRYNFGWIVWTWDNDGCAASQLSTNGNFSSLSSFGQVIVNDSHFGLKTQAHRTSYFANGLCGVSGVEEVTENAKTLSAYCISENSLELRSFVDQQVIITDISGKVVYNSKLGNNGHTTINLIPGIYLVQSNKQPTLKTVVY